MKKKIAHPLSIFILAFCTIYNVNAQFTLAIRQVGLLTDTIPVVTVGDVQDQKPIRLNDSTIQFNVPPTRSECLFIFFGHRWFTRVWIDSTIFHKELIVNYSKRTATIKNGNEIDKVLEKAVLISNKEYRHESDSISVAYIDRNPDSFFSLWLLSHGLNMDQPNKNSILLEKLSPRLKKCPEYGQTKANLGERKYPNFGDTFKEFTLTDKNDNIFHSTSIENKIIVLHFWSTGCVPCVKGMDALVNYYNTLDTSKVAFIAVSLDKDKNKWKKSETTNKIKWINLWTEDNMYCELCLNYNLTAMPYFVIFNKEKKITFYNEGEEIELLKSKILEIN